MDPELLRRMMLGEFSASGDGKEKPSGKKVKAAILDLHFDKLQPEKQHLNSGEKLQIQLETCIYFLREQRKTNARQCIVITGKGEGVLKKQVLAEIQKSNLGHAEVIYELPYAGNALRVHLK